MGSLLIVIGLIATLFSTFFTIATISSVGMAEIDRFIFPPLMMYLGAGLFFILPGTYMARIEGGRVDITMGRGVLIASLTPILVGLVYPSIEGFLLGVKMALLGSIFFWPAAFLLMGFDWDRVRALTLFAALLALISIVGWTGYI